MKTKHVLKSLSVVFTKDEILQLAKQSVDITLQIDEIENAKSKLNGLYDEVTTLAKKMKAGYEERNVRCEIRYNTPHNGKKTIIREDTGETVEITNMTAEELQEDLEFTDVEIVNDVKQLTSGDINPGDYDGK